MTEQNTLLISELQQQANDGDAQAQFELALCYAKGKDVERNMELAFDWHKKAAEQGHVNAQFALGLYYILNMGRIQQVNECLNKWILVETMQKVNPALNLAISQAMGINFSGADNDLAFTWLKKAAEQDHAEANYWLGICYRDGIGTECNNELSFECYKKAAEQGYDDAYYGIALCYHEGKGIEQSDELAAEWITKAVEHVKVEPEAYLLLGNLYAHGKGVQQNDELAVKWYQKAAEKDVAKAQYLLAICYEYGRGIERNMTLADKWYETVAEQDYFEADALFRFAECYLQGSDIEKNYELGMKWMIRSAHKGNADARYWLVNAYLSLAIPSCISDKEDAEQYYKFAADWCLKEVEGQNAPEAYLLLGILYYSGKGVEQSDERAFRCFEKAEDMAVNDQDDYIMDDPDNNEGYCVFASFYVGICYAQGKSIATVYSPEQNGFSQYKGHFHSGDLQLFGKVFVDGIIAMPFHRQHRNKVFLTLLRISVLKKAGEYELAREFTKEVFDKTHGMDRNFKESCLTGIDQEQEIAKQNEALKLIIKEKEILYKALHDKEKEMLSFFTHTMRNALATAPESLREAIQLLGSELYEKDTKHYQAINKIASLFSTLSLTDCLIDTFKQSINDPQEFKQSWQKDHSGEASPKWVIASALRQSLNRIIFAKGDTTELRKLLGNPETALIKATRKSFIEEVLPFNVDSQGVDVFYNWTLGHISAIEVSITDFDKLNFGVNQVRFSLLFAITSELILNALKYWDGENRIQISWQLTDQDSYVFSVKNHCKANATSNLAGTHKGLTFIKRLMELLGEQANFVCKSEDQLFTAELILNKALFDGEV